MSNSISEEFKPVFIVGMPRSGTTLLSTLISNHSRICISPETHYFNFWYKQALIFTKKENSENRFWKYFSESQRFQYFNLDPEYLYEKIRLEKDDFHKNILTCLLREYALKKGKLRWGEKTPRHYAHLENIFNWYPNAQVIFVIRDPRAVSASMQNVPWGGNRISSFAMRWKESISHLHIWKNDNRVIYTKYETLVLNPVSELKRILSFLDEDYKDNNPESLEIPEEESEYSGWAHQHFSAASKSPNTKSLTKWKTQLTKKEVAIVEYLNKSDMINLGYDLIDMKLSISIKILIRLNSWLTLANYSIKHKFNSRTDRDWASSKLNQN